MIDWSASPPFGRRVSLMHALELLHERRGFKPAERGAPLIVEIGTSESYNPDGLGNAMLAFAFYAGKHRARIKSVDAQCIENSRKILERFVPEFAGIPEFTLADAFDWAPGIRERIDFLYMDASFELSCDPSYGSFARRFADTIPSWYVELFRQFNPACFQPGALMLFDDTDPATYYGKGIHLIPTLLAEGWRQVSLHGEAVFPMALLEKI